MSVLDAGGVRSRLGLGEEAHREWTEALAALPTPTPAVIPSGAELTRLLRHLEVPAAEDAEIAAVLPELTAADSPYRPLLDRSVAWLAGDLGGLDYGKAGPPLPAGLGAPGRWFYFAVFLGAVPAVREYHRGLGIGEEITWPSLADLGNKVGVHRRTYGTGGMDKQSWMALPFRGALYRLGRLQFNLLHHPDGEPGLGVHIPEGGPMSAEACEDSYTRAAEFFPRHFGEFFRDGGRNGIRASCQSWLLDPQLAEYLPEQSNIVRFQRRYDIPANEEPPPWATNEVGAGGLTHGDRAVVEFVFRRMVESTEEVAALPARTTLERAVVQHVAAGRHWNTPGGYLTLRKG